jgi:hypothetical protein
MAEMAFFLEQRPAGYFCDHCHVYRGRTVLLEWYDGFRDNPIYVSRTVDREVVMRFAQAIRSSDGSDLPDERIPLPSANGVR